MFGFITRNSSFSKDLGLVVLRLGIGVIFAIHGWSKLVGGFPVWENLGKVLELFGIQFYPVAWGFLAAAIEFFGGIMIAIGFYTRVAALFLSLVMIAATSLLASKVSPFSSLAHPLSMLVVFVSLCITGSGGLSVDSWLKR